MSDSRTRAEIAEADRRIENVIRTGQIHEVDFEEQRVRVVDENWKSDWLPWLEARAHEEATWSPPQKGERVLILAPGGDLDQAVILTGLNCESFPPPSVAEKQSMRRFADGAFMRHDSETHLWELELPPEGTFRIKVGPTVLEMDAAGVRITAPRFDYWKSS